MKLDKQYVIDVVNTTRDQLLATTSQNVLGSWGVFNSPKKYIFSATLHKGMPTLAFDVDARLHSGSVLVAYNDGQDLYELYLKDSDGNVKFCCKGIYADMISETIDRYIETGDDWQEYADYCASIEKSLFSL